MVITQNRAAGICMKKVTTISIRAKRVTYPLLAGFIVLFVSNLIHVMMIGGSAFPGGNIVDGRYLVKEHGKVIELTRSTYWLSYFHTLTMVVVVCALALSVLYFHWTGDMKSEPGDEP
jgi:hypothetical protein